MRRTFALPLFLTCLVALGWGQDAATAQTVTGGLQAPTIDTKMPTAMTAPDYVIGADDTVHISVWKEPDFTATLPVRPDGKISLPLLNDVQAAGLTPMQLSAFLTDRLKKY